MVKSYLQDLGYALLNPKKLESVEKSRSGSLAAPGATVFIVTSGVMGALWVPMQLVASSTMGVPLGLRVSVLVVLGGGFLGLLYWVLAGVVLYLVSRLMGGVGGFGDTLRVLGYSTIGLWIMVPLVLAPGVVDIGLGMIGIISGLVLGLAWHLYSIVWGLSGVHRYSGFRAVASAMATLFVIVGVGFLLVSIIGRW